MFIGPLMIEHRLIERMIRVMEVLLVDSEAQSKVDPGKVDTIIHFIRSYADRCHHGKEEDILFRALDRKPLSSEHRRIMDELVEDHKLGRRITLSLLEANERYKRGDTAGLPVIADRFRSLVEFYPRHIEKEDKHFFMPVMGYFSPEEKEAMIREGHESDSRLLQEEYVELVKTLEGKK